MRPLRAHRSALSFRTLAAGLGLLLAVTACEETEQSAAADPTTNARTTTASARASDPAGTGADAAREASPKPGATRPAKAKARKKNKKRSTRHPSNERPLPAFEGRTVEGAQFSSRSLIGRRTLLLFFNPEEQSAATVVDAVRDLSEQEREYNFRVFGVGIGSNTTALREFVHRHSIAFPVVDDANARITSMLGLRSPLLALGVDPDGYVNVVHSYFDVERPNARKAIADMLRESLRIPTSEEEARSGRLTDHPQAPLFETDRLDGGRFALADLAGRPVVLIFFLHTCPHCHRALEFLEATLAKLPQAKRPKLIGISLQNRPTAVHEALRKAGIDDLEILADPGRKIAQLYRLKGGVPDITLIDASGHILYRMRGWREDRDPALMRIYLARLAGTKPPMLLSREGYTGNDVCAACHEEEHATWLYTRHARAYDSLVTHGEDRNEECVSCHVVGYEKKGGFSLDHPVGHLEAVGCETCHGRGGPHVSPGFVEDDDYAPICRGCHDPEHSLGFDYERFLPDVSHDAIAALDPKQRAERFAGAGAGRELLPTTAGFVGSDACRDCHQSEYATWAASPHAGAFASLQRDAADDDPQCLSCHTTGYGRRGGFPSGGHDEGTPDLARVGCESCHAAGGEHVAEGAKRIGTIVGLGDKCDSCVILQICGRCHDQDNDPDFEFEVQEHIERQRHGTIEAGTGKPLSPDTAGAAAAHPGAGLAEATKPATPAG